MKRRLEMDVSDQSSVDAAVATVVSTAGRIDVVVHNAGHMVLGPFEAFTTDELTAVYDTKRVVHTAGQPAGRAFCT